MLNQSRHKILLNVGNTAGLPGLLRIFINDAAQHLTGRALHATSVHPNRMSACLAHVLILSRQIGDTVPTDNPVHPAAFPSVSHRQIFNAILVCLFIYKTVTFKDLLIFFRQAVSSYAPLGLMMGLAQAFAKVLVLMNAPQTLAEFLSTAVNNRIAFLLLLNLVLILIGMVMDVAPAMMILSPMILPFAKSLGIDGIHLGVIMVCNLAIGFVTPPFGLNLFISGPMIDTNPMQVGKRALPFIISYLVALLLITYVPQISMALL